LEKYDAEILQQHKNVNNCLNDYQKLNLGKGFSTLLKCRKEQIEVRLTCDDIKEKEKTLLKEQLSGIDG
jgi:hypothetical protein